MGGSAIKVAGNAAFLTAMGRRPAAGSMRWFVCREALGPASRIREWQEAYSRLRHSLPSKYQLLHAKFDALNNRALYSREPLQRFWNDTVEQLKGMRLWNIHPGKLTTSLIKDLFLTTSFVFTFRAGSRGE